MALTPRQVYKGNPATPGYEPNKDDIIDYLNGLQTRIDAASPVYDSIAEGLAATTVGQFFNAFVDGKVNRYRHDPGPVATFIYEFPSSVAIEEVYALLASIGDYLTGTLTELTSTYSGDGTSDPLELITSVDNPAKIELSVNGATLRPGIDYDSTGVNLTPLPGGDYPEWPVGTDNILVRIRRQLDLADITSDDVTYDGEPLTNTLDDLFPGNTYHLTRYLHPDDFAAALAGNTAAQNEARVTAAVQAFHDEALGWMMGSNNRHVTLVYPNAVLAINDEMFSEAWAELLWTTGGSRTNCRIVFQFNGVRFQTKNWVARAAVRTSGLYLDRGITYAVPKVVFRYEAKTPGNPRIETQGRIHIFGSDNPDTDPIGVKFKSINISQFDCFFFQGLRNTAFYHENIFNSTFYNWQVNSCGYQPTEYGGNGFMSGTVRFQNVGRVITATEPVFDASHVGRRFMLVGAAAANGQGFQTHSGVIESVDSPTQITLTAATAPFRNVTDPVVASFEAIKATTTAGSNVVTLSAPITDNLAGRYVTLFGCGQNDIAYNGKYYGAMTVVVTAHSGDQITLAHPARLSRTGIPISFGTSMIITRGAENSVVVGSMAGRTDDCTYHDARIENGSSPFDGASMMAVIQHCSSTAFVGGTKFHGVTARTKNNFGANFANIGFDYATNVKFPESILTHCGYSSTAGKIILNGGFIGVEIECDEVAYPDTSETATVLCDPTPDQISVSLRLGNSRTDGRVGNAVKARYGTYGNAGMIVAANSAARMLRGIDVIDGGEGEDTVVGTGTTPAIPDWPTDLHDVVATGDVFATGYGSTRANAVNRIASGFWTPQNGRVYTIGGLQYLGKTGATAIADLPGLVPHGDWTFGHWGAAPSATATANTAAFRAAMDAVMAVLRDQGGTGMTIRLQSGVYLVNNEVLSDDFQSKWWAQTNLGKQKFINVEGDPAGTSEIRIDTSWLSGVRNTTNGNQRTSGPFSGAPSPAALWPVMANKDAAPAAFSLRNLRMRGTGTAGKDPIPLLVANELDARTIGLHVVNFANWGEVIMGSFNCAHVLNHFENCGTQPVESGRVLGSPAGYPSNTRVTFLNTAGTRTLLAKAAIAFDTYSVGDPVPFFEASHVGKVMVVHQGALSGGVGQPLAMTITSISGDKTTATYTPVNPSSVLRTQDNTAASFMPVTFTSTAGSAVINLSAPVILGRGAADMIGHMVAALKAGSNAAANMDTLVTRIVAVGSGNDTDGYSQLTLASTAKNAVTDVLLFSAGHACVSDEAFRASSLTWTVDDTDWLQCRYEHSGGYADGNNAGSCQFLVQDPGEAVQYVSCKVHGANTDRGQFASEAHCVVDSSSGLDLIGVDFTHFSHGPGQVRFMGGRQSTRLNGVSLGSWQQPANWIGYYLDPPSGYAAATWHVIDDKQTRVKNNSFPRLSQALWGGRSGLVKANILDIRFNDQTQLWDEALLLTSADNLNDFVTPMLGYWQTSVPTNAPGPFPNYSSFKSEKYDDTVVQSVYDLDNRYGFVRERFSGSWTAWRFVGSAPSSNTVNMTSAANIINTSFGKHAGMLVRNTTDSKLYYATGSTATSTWVSADGATTITPV